jgi:hypothetical protein
VDQSSEITDAIEKLDDRDLLRLVELVQAELKDRVRIYRIMGRLSDKLALAAAIVPRQAAKIEARADAIIAAEADLEKQTDESFSPHETMLDEARAGLDGLKHRLATMSNLPPLSASDASPAPPKACPRCANGSKPRQLGSGEWIHDVSVNGNTSISQVPCLNPPV